MNRSLSVGNFFDRTYNAFNDYRYSLFATKRASSEQMPISTGTLSTLPFLIASYIGSVIKAPSCSTSITGENTYNQT